MLIELNNKGFHVQKSTDGINFHEVTTIEGNGNTTETSFYRYVDKDVRAGQVYYYKLMQEDFDGKINPSKIVSAQLYNSESNWTVSEFIPNPAKTITSLHMNSVLNTGSCATDDDVTVIADVHATKYNTGDLPGAASGDIVTGKQIGRAHV